MGGGNRALGSDTETHGTDPAVNRSFLLHFCNLRVSFDYQPLLYFLFFYFFLIFVSLKFCIRFANERSERYIFNY